MQGSFSHPAMLGIGTCSILLAGCPSTLISLSPSHKWPPKEILSSPGGRPCRHQSLLAAPYLCLVPPAVREPRLKYLPVGGVGSELMAEHQVRELYL